MELAFGNDPELLASQIAKEFPQQIDGYRRLVQRLLDYDDIEQSDQFSRSAREVMQQELSDPLLIEMLLCPLMWYGNAREKDMDFGQFSIMFRACYLEGFARPFKGVRLILKQLVRQFRSLGGELKLRSGVRRIRVDGDRAIGVELEDGRELSSRRVLSSAGLAETMRLCDEITRPPQVASGRLSFIESISVLDCQPIDLGIDKTIVFYNNSEQFHWERPETALCDARTGVICSPNNYFYADGQQLPEGIVRITTLANHDLWCGLSAAQYAAEKVAQSHRAIDAAVAFIPDFRRRVVASDVFTPKTIHRFTWHDNGAVYGSPRKQLDGTTHLKNLYLCGTDQGYVGIIGAILSGIGIANRYCLRDIST
jgi:phytoene dehydrogenase-like protein